MDKREIRQMMEFLQIEDVTTKRQLKNGTVVWKLPIRVNTDPSITKFIEVASFKTGYVRNQNSGYSNYQLNKRYESEPEYYQLANGDYRKYTTRTCKLIPNEKDRLEYLIAYCLKNYYIKNANQVAEGSYVSKWYHEWELERNAHTQKQRGDGYKEGCSHKNQEINNLQNKLATIERIANDRNKWNG